MISIAIDYKCHNSHKVPVFLRTDGSVWGKVSPPSLTAYFPFVWRGSTISGVYPRYLDKSGGCGQREAGTPGEGHSHTLASPPVPIKTGPTTPASSPIPRAYTPTTPANTPTTLHGYSNAFVATGQYNPPVYVPMVKL